MATNNRGGNRGNTGNRGGNNRSRNHNPEGHNQFDRGIVESARDRPFTAAATIGGVVAAGVFLWSRRNQISDQISGLSEQLADWREGIGSTDGTEFGGASRTSGKSQTEFAEEALTLKETGKKAKSPTADLMDEQSKVGSVAY